MAPSFGNTPVNKADAKRLRLLQDALASFNAGNLPEAERCCRKLLSKPGDPVQPLNLLGAVLCRTQRHEEAIHHFKLAIKAAPRLSDGYINLATAYAQTYRYADAIDNYVTGLSLDDNLPLAHNNFGILLSKVGRIDDALAHFDRAIALVVDYGDAWFNKGNLLFHDLKRADAAIACYERAIMLYQRMSSSPDMLEAMTSRLECKLHACEWSNFEAESISLRAAVRSGGVVNPFAFLAIAASPSEQLSCARQYAAAKFPPPAGAAWNAVPTAHARIRIAYVSSDFRPHPLAYLLAGVIAAHDRDRFEVIGISLTPEDTSEFGQRIKSSFCRFIDASAMSDAALVAHMRDLEIDIAVDLNGHTRGARTPVFAARVAPVQVSYLGYVGSLGAPYMDYLIADRMIIPETEAIHYSEKIAYVASYQANDGRRELGGQAVARSELGFADDAFIFCCFNNNYKITPGVFQSWMKILERVPNGVLWLYVRNETARANLRREAAARGVDPQRIVFAGRVDYGDYLARYRVADLFLDTLPYNAGATASDALWAGLPVLTRRGESFAGRMGASLLTAVGLPELITDSPQAYEDLAVDLAGDPATLAAIRRRLDEARTTSALFDTARTTRQIEAAYAAMHERVRSGLPPAHIAPAD